MHQLSASGQLWRRALQAVFMTRCTAVVAGHIVGLTLTMLVLTQGRLVRGADPDDIPDYSYVVQAGQKDWVLACSGNNFAVWEALL